MIRDADTHDLPQIARLIVEFYKTVMGKDTFYSEYTQMLEELLDSGIVLVSVKDDVVTGMIVGRVIDNPVFKTIVLQELVWYDKAGNGGRLAKAFLEAGKELGVDAVYMTVLDSAGERTHDFVKRVMKGVPIERNYIIKM